MTWKEIKSWASDIGYECKKAQEGYSWKHIESNYCSTSKSVSKLARDVFNHMTENKWIEYQHSYET